ncbi:hypothetical protein L195_g051566, partial [Trifolium pratense]
MNRVRGLNASAGFMLPGSMLDSIFVVDSFVGAAGSRRRNNNNNRRLSSPPTATTTRDIGGVNHRPHVPPPSFNVLNGTMADDFVIVFDTYVGRN